jgi:hypothetical protein
VFPALRCTTVATPADDIDLGQSFGTGIVPFAFWSSASGDTLGDGVVRGFLHWRHRRAFKDVDIDIDTSVCDTLPGGCTPRILPKVAFAGHVGAVRGGSP